MHKLLYLILILASLLEITSCKTKEESAPIINFSWVPLIIKEGDTVQFKNESSHGSVYQWTIDSLGLKSSEIQPRFILTKAGKYNITLKGKNGDGITAEKSLIIEVLPDSIYRISHRSKKVWIVKSIIYSGNELVTENCQKDDEFTLFYGKTDSCTLTEANNQCPMGTYIFELPASSLWRFNSKQKALEFGLVALGSPINFSFVTTELTHTTFKGKDALNDVSIHLEAKP